MTVLKPAVLVVLATSLVLSACEEAAPPEVEERVRAIKTFVVQDRAGADQRRFSGILEASNTSGLAFAVPGTVATVEVSEGDRVAAGDVLATLDPTLFDNDVGAAEAELASSRAAFSEAESDLQRQQQLFDKGWVSQAALDQALAAFRSAEASVNLYRTRLGTAQRDRERTILRAPFDGVIAERAVEPFEEVQAAATILQINSEGAMEAVFSVPDQLVDRLSLGAEVQVDVSSIASCGCRATISEIGRASGAANAVDVKASLMTTAEGLLPGMALQITAFLSDTVDERGLLVPLAALAPGEGDTQGYVFVFNPEEGIVNRVAVQGSGQADGNLVEISTGLSAGDIVASAGVSFLRDGQRVRQMQE